MTVDEFLLRQECARRAVQHVPRAGEEQDHRALGDGQQSHDPPQLHTGQAACQVSRISGLRIRIYSLKPSSLNWLAVNLYTFSIYLTFEVCDCVVKSFVNISFVVF